MSAQIIDFQRWKAAHPRRARRSALKGPSGGGKLKNRRRRAREAVIPLLRRDRSISVHELFSALGGRMIRRGARSAAVSGRVSLGSVRNVLKAALREGLVEVEGRGVRHYPTKYRLRPAPFTFVDLFSGIGGMRLALEGAGGECVFSCEIDRRAADTYEANFKDRPCGDIRGIQPHDVPDHDVIAAGFPCPPWSLAGKRRGFADPRAALFFNVAELIRVKRPRAVILENVKGLATRGFRSGLAKVVDTLRGLGYVVHTKVLNALHFGLPQKRERIIIVGFRDDLPFAWPDVIPGTASLADFLDPEADADPALLPTEEAAAKVQRIVAAKGTRVFEPAVWHTNLTCNVSVRPHSVALRAEASANYILVNGRRRPSARELLRWQGFPSHFQCLGSYRDVRRQTGNAVPVPMIRAVAAEVRQALHSECLSPCTWASA